MLIPARAMRQLDQLFGATFMMKIFVIAGLKPRESRQTQHFCPCGSHDGLDRVSSSARQPPHVSACVVHQVNLRHAAPSRYEGYLCPGLRIDGRVHINGSRIRYPAEIPPVKVCHVDLCRPLAEEAKTIRSPSGVNEGVVLSDAIWL